MAAPLDASKPKLAIGCRWGGTDAERVVLFPEGAIRVQTRDGFWNSAMGSSPSENC